MAYLAIAAVIVAIVAAVAYAAPKIYGAWLQGQLVREAGAQDMERFEALKESHDKHPEPPGSIMGAPDQPPGQYI